MCSFHSAGERNRGYALLMTANKPETALYRAPTFSIVLVSHVGLDKICQQNFEQNRLPEEISNSASKMGCQFYPTKIENEKINIVN